MKKNGIINSSIENIYSLTPLQEGMLYHSLADSESTGYVIQNVFSLSGIINEERTIQALNLIVMKHNALRTVIVYEKLSKPRQIVLKSKEAEYEKLDLSGLNEQERTNKFEEIKTLDVKRGFDLQNDTLLRVKYVILGPDNVRMIWSYHHIILDGWCLSILFGDFIRYYNALCSGSSMDEMQKLISEEKKYTPEYGEYIKWLESKDKEEGIAYWNELLSDYEEIAEIKPLVKLESTEQQMKKIEMQISKELSDSLQQLAASSNLTINTIVEATWGVVLQKYNHTEDVVFGKVVSGRNADIKGIENVVGLFINTIPVRVKCNSDMTVKELLQELKKQGMDSDNYSYCSLSEVQGVTRQKGELIKTLYVFENYYVNEENIKGKQGGLQFEMESAREQTNYAITVAAYMDETTAKLKLIVMYNPNEYGAEEIQCIPERIVKVLESFVSKPEGKIGDIETITEIEKQQILEEFNNTWTAYPRDKTVVDLLEEQVEKTPENIAVIYGENQLTYKALNEKANQLAWKLRTMGIKSEDLVVVMAERSLEMIIGIYGILKAGGAYVPVDLNYPMDRIQYIIEDSQPKVILTYHTEIETKVPIINLADSKVWEGGIGNPSKVTKPEDLAYVIYTSGTTGQPKGSLITNKGIVRLVKNTNYISLNENSTIMQTGSMAFDASTFEVWGAFLNGGKLILGDNDIISSSENLKNMLKKHSGNTMFLTTALFNQMIQIDPSVFDSLQYLMFGGEKASEKHIRILKSYNANVELINLYEPTENTSLTTSYNNIPSEFDSIPIGKPIANNNVYIFSKDILCGVGIPGELCITGDGLARGYLNMPELTEEKFVDNPFGEGKMYRSGDLARWLPDGNIEYLGRIDEQVKIRGFRIELGEIENVIKKLANIKDATVIANEDAAGDKAIYAYIVADKEISILETRDMLREILPEYMIPAYMLQIERIPVTRTGKVDKRALPQIENKSEKEYIAPRNEVEEAVCKIFSEILGVEQIGVKDSFFELGGDSIKAIRIVSKMRTAGYEVSVKEIMNKYTVEGIAYAVKASCEQNKYEQNEATGKITSTPIVREFEGWKLAKPNHFNQDIMLKIDTDDEAQIKKALDALAIHHDIIRSVYRDSVLEILSSRNRKLYDFYKYDYSMKEAPQTEIEAECTRLQGSIDLENGPLMKTALFKLKEENYLFMCLHHLVVDGVSWRILLEDFDTALKQVKEGKKIVLPEKTASFIEWGEALEEYRNSKQLKKEQKYWEEVLLRMQAGKVKLRNDGTGTGYDSVQINFSIEETEELVHEAGKAFNTEINDLLIGAIGMAIKKLTGQEKVSIGLEGHGREEIHKKIAIDRTVGWFTSMYPIVVECSEDVQQSIISNKEMLRQIPNHGIGYGLLKNELSEIKADIYFNYLGQMDAETKDNKAVFFSTGKSSADENNILTGTSINGGIVAKALVFTIAYDRSNYEEATIQKLAELYKEALHKILGYCKEQKETVKTASDYSAIDLTMPELLTLKACFNTVDEIDDIYSLTPMQEGMLYHNMADDNSTGYVIQQVLRLKDSFEEEKIIQVLKLLVMRYDILRTAVVYEKLIKPRQVVLNSRELEYEKIDLSSLNEQEGINKLEEIETLDVNRGFDLQKDTLLRVKYIALGQNRVKMIWTYHHIIIDGWCMSLLFGDFIRYYNALCSGSSMAEMQKLILEEKKATPEYGEYLRWLESKDKEAGNSYWDELLYDYEEIAEIKPLVKPESTKQQMKKVEMQISKELSDSLQQLAVSNNLTINTILEATWGVVLQRYNHTEDVVFGKVVSGRNADIMGIENMVGLFVNTIPVRVKCNSLMTVKELLQELKKQGMNSDNCSYCSLSEVQALTRQKGDLIKTLYVFENYYVNEENLKGKQGEIQFEMESAREQTNYAITVASYMDETTSKLKLIVMYNPNEYVAEEIQRIPERIEKVLEAFILHPEAKIAEIEIITEAEKQQILGEFNNTRTAYPRHKTVVELLEEQVEKTPENIAAIYDENQLTYKELNEKANQLAYKLRALGVKPDDFVVVMAERSIELVAGICGILKAGGAYVPVDLNYPMDRIQYMIEDCKPKAILLYQTEIETNVPVIDLADSKVWEGASENLEKVNQPKDLTYVIYTSGTTGHPKGSLITNKSIVRLVKNTNFISLNENSTIMQTGSMAFDASTFEVWGALLNGGKLILGDTDIITNSERLKNKIKKHEVNTMWLTSSLYNQMIQIDEKMFDSLKHLLIGGEKLSEKHVRMLKSRNNKIELINGYGPTENTTFTATYAIPSEFDRIPIGKPIANTNVYILNKAILCGIGIPGELCITGDGLARGYLNRPELTKEKFVDNPFGEGKMYRSGDLARWLPDGKIEYLGRIDEQVKIRGFRIELGEIENVIKKLANIKDATVIAKEDAAGDKAIYAYIVADKEISILETRDMLREILPEYMIPAYMLQIERIPVTRTGKVDKRALPQIENKSEKEYIAPRNEAEEAVCKIFSEILGVEQIGVKDSFFELGGDSIKAIRIVSKMRTAGYEVSVKEIMSKYTVEGIAYAIKASCEQNKYEQNEATGKVTSTPIIHEFEEWKLAKPNHFNQDIMLKIDTEDEAQIKKVLNALAIHHDIIRSVYRNNTLEILNSKESKLYDFYKYDYSMKEAPQTEIEAECTRLQGSIDLENGPLMKTALFKLKEENYLFMCLHHLVVDGVSWRILLEDFDTALKQAKEGKAIVLPEKTASFIAWTEALEEYRNSKQLKKEQQYWEEVLVGMQTGKVKLNSDGTGTGYDSIQINFSIEETEELVHEAGKAFNTEINDLLIGAIGMAIKKLTGQEKVSIGLEGHGREEIHKKIAIDRTVGWFTSMYPIVVKCSEDVQQSIISNKEMLRQIPNHGIGYGLLKSELSEMKADIYFNYLGQMDAEAKDNKAVFFSTGRSYAVENNRLSGTSINGGIIKNTLVFTIAYNRGEYAEATVQKLAELYKESLQTILRYCREQKENVKTASDYSTRDLSMLDLLKLKTRFDTVDEINDIYSLTPMQEGMLYHNIADSNSTGYVIQQVLRMKNEVDEGKIIQALKLLVMRYDILRTVIVHEKLLKPRQVVLNSRELEYENIDLSGLNEQEGINKLEEIKALDVNRGFDLQKDTLLRIKYVILGQNRVKMIWTYHHIIIDGWCMSLLFGDFIRYYNALCSGSSMAEMQKLISGEKKGTPEYGEYLKWLESKEKEDGIAYWDELLSDYEEIAEIKPSAKAERTESQMEREVIQISKELSARLQQTASSNNLTINTIVEAAWGIVLQRYNHTDDIVFGKVVSGRNADITGIENMVGLFINAIPVRVKCFEDMKVIELLQELKRQGMESENYSYCSLAEVQGLTRQKGELIKTLYVFENYYINEDKLKGMEGGLEFETESAREQTNYAITVAAYMDEATSNLKLIGMYNPNEFVAAEIHRILSRIEKVLQAFAVHPEGKIVEIETITETEKQLIIEEFNNTYTDYPRDKTVVDLFEEQVEKAPNSIAIIFENKQLTYAELNEKANQLAWKLRELGVKPDNIVALVTERSFEMIIGIFGIMKAGGAYVPIDPTYPVDRIQYMINDCNPKAILTYQAEIKTQVPLINLADSRVWEGSAENLEKVNKPGDLAYVIYTSGTTGTPKGVMLKHCGVVCMRSYLLELYKIDEKDNVLQFANYVFDASVWEITISLLNGAKLVLIPSETIRDIRIFNEYVKEKKISITLLPPQYYLQTNIEGLKVLTTGGSASNLETVCKSQSNMRYINAYGPTENTVLATHWENEGNDKIPNNIPIGKPISNSKIYVMNGSDMCGVGIPGELCIAGAGLARGYLNKPELTAEKFINNPFGKGKLYRSGDLVRWLSDGNIEYLGRIDEQVKIRGFRIELGEIENVIRSLENIKDIAVISREDATGEKAIYAYFVADEEISIATVKDNLRKVLPEYMLPAYMMQIEHIPVTRSGKADKKALPVIDINMFRREGTYVDARSKSEKRLKNIWNKILQNDTIGIYDNFFEIGGNSLLITRMLTQIDNLYPNVLKVGDIFANPTIAQLAEQIELKAVGIMQCTQTTFPDRFFNQVNRAAYNNRLMFKDDGIMYQKMSALLANCKSDFEELLLFAYSFLLHNITGEKELCVCGSFVNKYFSFNINVDNIDDLNEFMKLVSAEYLKAKKYQNVNIRTNSKSRGLLPIFLYKYNGNNLYKSFADFAISFNIDDRAIYLEVEIINRKVSERNLQDLLDGYVVILKTLFK